jgi:hypothetical protein
MYGVVLLPGNCTPSAIIDIIPNMATGWAIIHKYGNLVFINVI